MVVPLTFDVLDDVMSLSPSEQIGEITSTTIEQIGPLVEYIYRNYENALHTIHVFDGTPVVRCFSEAIRLSNIQRFPNILSLDAQRIEFFKPPQYQNEFDDKRWLAFRRRMEDAARKSGLAIQFARGLVATAEEMVNNVIAHSEYPQSSVVGYRWSENEFEYVVADSGIGVLNSLSNNPRYSFLVDSGEAIEFAIRSGESRFGKGSGHGFGFDNLVINIANQNSQIRFRSGDHSLTLDGTSAQTHKIIRQCSDTKGFLISVICTSHK